MNSISLITIMGLIGENCRRCVAAAEAEDGGGLAGRWWRFWEKVRFALGWTSWVHHSEIRLLLKANDNSGYIGAAIVGACLGIVVGWYTYRWGIRKVGGRAK